MPHVTRPATVRRRQELLDEALALLAREYAAGPDLDEVARRLATSRRQLQRCFEEQGEGSFRACLARIRMERAAELLRGTDLPFRDVAARVGYRQPAQFAKAFARHQGTVPSAYRAQHRPALAA